MQPRLNYQKFSPEPFKKLFELSSSFKDSPITQEIRDLVHIHASQYNGCAFCLDMHVKEAKIHGERELRIHHLPIFRESPLFTDKEKAILELTELVTEHSSHGISDEQYGRIREFLSEKEISDLTFDIGIINMWNRLNLVSRSLPGSLDAAFGLDKSGLK